MKYFAVFFFSSSVFNVQCVFHTYSTSQFRPTTFQVLSGRIGQAGGSRSGQCRTRGRLGVSLGHQKSKSMRGAERREREVSRPGV